jgi:hypothetical protein
MTQLLLAVSTLQNHGVMVVFVWYSTRIDNINMMQSVIVVTVAYQHSIK